MRDVKQLHPRLQTKIQELIDKCAEQGYKIKISECLRTIKEQDDLYAQGRTKKGNIVTNCKGSSYNSMHQWGIAFDFYRADGKGSYYDKDNFFTKVGRIGQSIGLEWGGSWKSIKDTPHFQLPDWGSTVTKLKKQYGRPEVFFKTWNTETTPSSATSIELTDINDIAYRLKVEEIALSSDYWMDRMNTDVNVYALCKNIANYTLHHKKGKDNNTKFTNSNDICYRLIKSNVITNSNYWMRRMDEDVNLFALGKKASEWIL